MDEECDNFDAEVDCNVCSHFIGDIWINYQCIKCSQYCSLALLKEKSEINVKRCNNG